MSFLPLIQPTAAPKVQTSSEPMPGTNAIKTLQIPQLETIPELPGPHAPCLSFWVPMLCARAFKCHQFITSHSLHSEPHSVLKILHQQGVKVVIGTGSTAGNSHSSAPTLPSLDISKPITTKFASKPQPPDSISPLGS